MADSFASKFDDSGWDALFTALTGEQRESFARKMAVEGGVMLRDHAQQLALIADNKEGVPRRGLLSHAMYLAYVESASGNGVFTYRISWNAKKAPHGHLIEFGHWRTHVVYKGPDGNWYSDKTRPLANPVWVSARPFLRPTLNSHGTLALKAMVARGKREFSLIFGG